MKTSKYVEKVKNIKSLNLTKRQKIVTRITTMIMRRMMIITTIIIKMIILMIIVMMMITILVMMSVRTGMFAHLLVLFFSAWGSRK